MLLALVALRLVADRYAMAVDRGDGALFAGQFTQGGLLIAPRGRFEGAAELVLVPAMVRQSYLRTHHSVTGLVPEFDGDGRGAAAHTYALARHFYRNSGGRECCYEMTVRYEDRFLRTAAGWKLDRRELVLVGEAVWPVRHRPSPKQGERQ